jgi:hypothetical protein
VVGVLDAIGIGAAAGFVSMMRKPRLASMELRKDAGERGKDAVDGHAT